MRNKMLFGAMLAGFLTAGYALTYDAPVADAGGPKNLKVYPKGTKKKAIKKDMKSMAKALGVQCDHCHDMGSMDKDTPMKNKARTMMRMMKSANATLKKNGMKGRVTCNTCHRGKKEPK
jgi:hypothetical protein